MAQASSLCGAPFSTPANASPNRQLPSAPPTAAKSPPGSLDLADAWLHAGPRDLLTDALPFPGIYRDAYWQELQRRHQLMLGTPLDAASGDINTNARYYVRPRKGR